MELNKHSVSEEELVENRKSAAAADAAEYLVDKYFEGSGENKQDYIDAIEADKSGVVEIPETKWMPKVGEECEGLLMDQENNSSWMVIKLLYNFDDEWAVQKVDAGTLAYCDEFRPLKTEKEKERDAFVDACFAVSCALHNNANEHSFNDLFDAGFKAPEGE